MPRWLLSSSNWCPLSCSCFPVCVCVCLCVCVCVCVAGGVGRGARLAHGQTDRQTDRHAHRQTDTHTADTQQTHRRTHTVRFPTCVLLCSLQVRGMHPLSLFLSLSASAHALRMGLCVPLHVFLTTCVPYKYQVPWQASAHAPSPYIYADMPPYVSVYAPQRRSRVRLRIGSTRNCRSGEWMPRVCSCGSNVLLDRMRTSSDRWGMRRDEWWWKGRRRRRRRRRRVY